MSDHSPTSVGGTSDGEQPEADEAPQSSRSLLLPVIGAAVFVGASVAFAQAAIPLLDIIGVVVFAAVIAWLNAPMQARIARLIGRGAAILVLVLTEMIAVTVAAGLILSDLEDLMVSLSRSAHRALAIQGAADGLGSRFQHALQLDEGVRSWLSTLPQRLFFNSATTPAAGQRFVDVLIVAVLTAFFMASGPAIVAAVVARWPREQREAVWSLARDVDRRAGGFIRRAILVGLATGGVVTAIAAVTDLPYPALLGAWAAFWVSVPRLGWWIATVPLIGVTINLDLAPLAAALIGSAIVVTIGVYAHRHFATTALRPGVALILTAAAAGVATSGALAAVFFVVVAVIAAGVWTSPHRAVGLPFRALPSEAIYEVGPLRFPRGIYGVVWSAAVVAGVTLAWFTVVRASAVVVWIAIAVLVAIAIDRPVDFVSRHLRAPRTIGLGIVFAIAIALGSVLVVSIVSQGPSAVGRALERVPAVVRQGEHLPVVGQTIRTRKLASSVSTELERLPERIASGSTAKQWFPQLGNEVIGILWVFLLISAYLIDGRRVIEAVGRRVPARYRRQTNRFAQVTYGALAGFARGSLLVALMCGTVVLILGVSLGVPLAAVAALWAVVWDLVPQIGGVIGGIPLLLFAIAVSPTAFLIALAVYLVYQLIESNLIFPAIIGENVELPGWAALVAVLAGAAAAGVVGAIVLTPIVAATRLIIREYRREDFPGRSAPTLGAAEPAAP